ncbi:hotdog fold domain-containing protein [Caldisericum exile]|uniref:hotdog fold domain-containing protein n=1 Tax=Caldisericum exile TaxID=693075 RepID=UPI00155A68A0|nr:hotdog fold domain-containing protein [Caldisericum exile]
MNIQLKDGFTYAEFSLDKDYEGYPGIIHGGIIAAILDDIMANVKFLEGYILYTVELDIRYLKHCLVDQRLFAYGYQKDIKHNIFYAYGEIKDESGEIKATGFGKYFIKGVYK